MSDEAIKSAILWHLDQVAILRRQVSWQPSEALLEYARSIGVVFNAAEAHRAVCPWARRISVNQSLARLAAAGKLERFSEPGRVDVLNGTRAAWYRWPTRPQESKP